MNMSQQIEKALKWLLPVLLVVAGVRVGLAQGVVKFQSHQILSADTLEVNFLQYHILYAPKISVSPSFGSAWFDPSIGGNFGVKGYGIANNLFYKPDPGFIGYDYIEVDYQELGVVYGFSMSATLVIKVLVLPSFLYAENDYTSTNVGQSVVVNVLANDYGSNGSALIIKGVPHVNNGTISAISDSTITFNPAPGFAGVAHFDYTVCDNAGSCDVATVSVCVIDSQPPAYDSIFITTKRNTPQVILLPLEGFNVIVEPSNGSLDFSDMVEYVPNPNYVGYDYMLFEDAAGAHVKVIEVRVLDATDPNTFLFDDFAFTPIGQEVEVNVLSNDVGGTHLNNVSALGGGISQQGGSLTYVSKGVYNYSPPAGFQGVDQFDYQASSYGGNFERATAYITVSNLNPSQAVFQLSTPKNTPLVIVYNVPILDYSYKNITTPNLGTAGYYAGNQTVVTTYGQQVSGYNMLVYTPNQDVTGTDQFEFEYCVSGTTLNCPLIKLIIDVVDIIAPVDTLCAGAECVWAGDANHDGVVNINDLLPIGLCMGEVGTSRTNPALEWYGQYGADWNSLFDANNFDVKHVDTDGDGIIEALDTAALCQFYGKRHNLTAEAVGMLNNLPFFIEEPDFTNIQPGDVILANIHLGNDQFPAIDAYGLTFQLGYDPAIFSSVSVTFKDNSWMAYNSPVLGLSQKPFDGMLDAGYTRTSGVSASGYGIIGTAEFIVIDDIAGNRLNSDTTTIQLTPFGLMNSAGKNSILNSSSITLKLDVGDEESISNEKENTSIDESQLKVYPNPVKDALNVHLNGLGNEVERVAVYSIIGQQVYDSGSLQAKHTQVDVSRLTRGIYVMKVFTNKGMLNKKFEVMR